MGQNSPRTWYEECLKAGAASSGNDALGFEHCYLLPPRFLTAIDRMRSYVISRDRDLVTVLFKSLLSMK